MRTCAQLVSYEVSLSLSVLGVIMLGQSLNLSDIVHKQIDSVWYVVPQFVGFLVFFVAALAETARAPFDLTEADSELVAGYHTEYGGMRWGLFQMAEYVNMIVALGARGHALLRRLGRSVGAARPALVRDQAVDRDLDLHLDPRHRAAPALRPADALRLEGAPAGRHTQRTRHRPRRRLDRMS